MTLNNFFLQPFNKKYVAKSPFTMPGVYEVPDTLSQGNWAIKTVRFLFLIKPRGLRLLL